MNIRLKTCLVVRRGKKYLRGRSMVTGELLWSDSPYDAWQTREKPDAERVAGRIGGELWLFNPVIGKTKERSYT